MVLASGRRMQAPPPLPGSKAIIPLGTGELLQIQGNRLTDKLRGRCHFLQGLGLERGQKVIVEPYVDLCILSHNNVLHYITPVCKGLGETIF